MLLGLGLALPVGPPWLPLGAPVADEPGPPVPVMDPSSRIFPPQATAKTTVPTESACASIMERVIQQSLYARARVAAVSVTSPSTCGELT